MPSTFSGSQRGLLVFDTGPLWELVLFQAVNQLGFARLRSDLRFLLEQKQYDMFSQYISYFRQKTTTPSVVAEISAKIRQTDPGGRAKLWGRVHDEFVNMGMDEDIVKLLQMSLELVAKFGAVDMSVLEIARRNLKLRPEILTIDDALVAECKRAGLQAFHLSEVIA